VISQWTMVIAKIHHDRKISLFVSLTCAPWMMDGLSY